MKEALLNQWRQLEPRERTILAWGTLIVAVILFYALVWQPWHNAIAQMEEALQERRTSLVWMQEQSKLVQNGSLGQSIQVFEGVNQSLLSVVEQSARANEVTQFIQQMTPSSSAQGGNEQVDVVLDEANFSQWVRWVDSLYRDYGVNIKQLTADNDSGEPNIVELRVTFERG